jgi:uncharacterized membrane protein
LPGRFRFQDLESQLAALINAAEALVRNSPEQRSLLFAGGSMKRFTIVYISTLVVLLPLDFLFLGTIGKKLFAANVGDMTLASPRITPAILFYIVYLAGIVTFVNGSTPSNWTSSLLLGALFGLFCYSTFELTNMALLKHWEWAVVIPDIAWGVVLTAVAAALGGLIASWVAGRV